MMDLIVSPGMWLQKRRKALDLTCAELASSAGCSESALRKIENGERKPSKQLAWLLANCLEIPLLDQTKFVRFMRGELNADQLATTLRPPPSFSLYEHPSLISSTELPVYPSPLIGRDIELSTLFQLLRDPNCRLLTLTGLGGIGKTRLAIEVAATVQQEFRDGVHFVSLASLNSPEFILTTIAAALGFSFNGPTETKIQLLNYLSQKSSLIVLDNFDCFVDSASLITQILLQSPKMKLLVTSRERLDLTDEWLFELHGLPVPPAGLNWVPEDYYSAALFLQVARRKQADFTLSPEDKLAVARICQLLEGMPLGIELAASWLQTLSCQEIAQEIERSLDFLATTQRDKPERHRSLRAVFDHSWNLLTDQERQVLCSLTIFPGGFYRQAAEQVCQASLPLLSSLVSKSLVSKLGGSRYSLHELIRQYASAQLEKSPEEVARLRDRHSRFYLAWLKGHEAALISGRQKELIEQLTFEIDNLRQAWEWAIDHRLVDLIRQAAWSLWYQYEVRGLFREGEAMLLQAVEWIPTWCATDKLDGELLDGTLGYLQVFLACLEFRQGRIQEAYQVLQRCVIPLQKLNDQVGLANAFLMYGTVCMFMGKFHEALECLHKANTYARASNRSWELGISLVLIGRVNYQMGNYRESHNWISEGLALGKNLGDPNLITFSISSLVETDNALRYFDKIEMLLREGIQVATDNGSRFTYAMLQEQLALVLNSTGKSSEADQLCQQSIALYKKLGDDWSLSRALNLMGNFKLSRQECSQAQEFFASALKIAFKSKSYPNAYDSLSGIAAGEAGNQNILLALELTYHILQSPFATRQAQNFGNRLLEELEKKLSPEQIETAKMSAQTQSLDQIIDKITSAAK